MSQMSIGLSIVSQISQFVHCFSVLSSSTVSPSQDCTHPDDHNLLTYDMTPGSNPSGVTFYLYDNPVLLSQE